MTIKKTAGANTIRAALNALNTSAVMHYSDRTVITPGSAVRRITIELLLSEDVVTVEPTTIEAWRDAQPGAWGHAWVEFRNSLPASQWNKITAIKFVREKAQLGLREANDLVEANPTAFPC
jgi:hypothetical protein